MMQSSNDIPHVKVLHDLDRQILEIFSLFRVLNNYYHKKSEIQESIRPLILKKFRESLKTLEKNKDWLFSLPTAITTLNEEFTKKKDSFRFPDSIILFEAWLALGFEALYPRVVLHFKFPGLLKGEKKRNIFQFIYASSRGFGFPINFGPEFYEYQPVAAKILDVLFKWCYTVNHRINQAVYLAADRRFNFKRHHPGEFESVIISEYENKAFKGIDTLLHGYFTNEPQYLGIFSSLEETLKNVMFSYTIGDHAMSVKKEISSRTKKVPILTHDYIVEKYDVNFYAYIKKVIHTNIKLNKKIKLYKKKKKNQFNKLSLKNKIIYRLSQSKRISFSKKNIPERFAEIEKFNHYKHLTERLRELLWTTPLFTHTVHTPTRDEKTYQLPQEVEDAEAFERDSSDSILLAFIKQYEKTNQFKFEEKEIIKEIKKLRDHMAKMWLYFKERQFRYATKKLNELASLSLQESHYKEKVNDSLDKLIPIISIYEIFHRPLAESVYPESISQTERLGAYLARVMTSKYNPLGIGLMKLFNRLAFKNWSYFIVKRKLNIKKFFDLVLKLPIWKHIPDSLKQKMRDQH